MSETRGICLMVADLVLVRLASQNGISSALPWHQAHASCMRPRMLRYECVNVSVSGSVSVSVLVRLAVCVCALVLAHVCVCTHGSVATCMYMLVSWRMLAQSEDGVFSHDLVSCRPSRVESLIACLRAGVAARCCRSSCSLSGAKPSQ